MGEDDAKTPPKSSWTQVQSRHVRFPPVQCKRRCLLLADMCAAKRHVHFTPESDQESDASRPELPARHQINIANHARACIWPCRGHFEISSRKSGSRISAPNRAIRFFFSILPCPAALLTRQDAPSPKSSITHGGLSASLRCVFFDPTPALIRFKRVSRKRKKEKEHAVGITQIWNRRRCGIQCLLGRRPQIGRKRYGASFGALQTRGGAH